MDIKDVINPMIVLFLLLLVGLLAQKLGMMDAQVNKKLTKIIMNICQSCMIFSAIVSIESEVTAGRVLYVLGFSCVTYVILIAIGLAATFIMRVKAGDRGIFRFMFIFGNVGFMGIPLISSIFGAEGVFYVSLFGIVFNILVYTLGIILMTGGEKRPFSLKQLVNAPMAGVALGLIFLATGFRLPEPVMDAVGRLADMIVPASMMVIGCSLGGISIKAMLSDWRMYIFTPIKLVAAPVIVWAALRLVITDQLLLGVITVLAAMPVASLATMFTIEYGGDEALASSYVSFTTFVSVATIPLVCYLLLI